LSGRSHRDGDVIGPGLHGVAQGQTVRKVIRGHGDLQHVRPLGAHRTDAIGQVRRHALLVVM
jgi:hypothetical protein